MRFKTSLFPLIFALQVINWGCTRKTEGEETQSTETTLQVAEPQEEKRVLVIQPQTEPDTLKGSLQAEANGQIGTANVRLSYYSPAVRGRVVWGGLVPYDQVWVTGAHMATNLQTDQALTIGGQAIPAGKYAFFTIPGKDEWTVIINRNWEQHLADKYDRKEDLVRVKVKPQTTGQHQERLRYEVNAQSGNDGEIAVSWERQRIALPVTAR